MQDSISKHVSLESSRRLFRGFHGLGEVCGVLMSLLMCALYVYSRYRTETAQNDAHGVHAALPFCTECRSDPIALYRINSSDESE